MGLALSGSGPQGPKVFSVPGRCSRVCVLGLLMTLVVVLRALWLNDLGLTRFDYSYATNSSLSCRSLGTEGTLVLVLVKVLVLVTLH